MNYLKHLREEQFCADPLFGCSQGYFLAAFLYMSIVFVLPLSLGLYAVALNLPVSIDEAYGGLIMPASAFVMMGKSGEHLLTEVCCSET